METHKEEEGQNILTSELWKINVTYKSSGLCINDILYFAAIFSLKIEIITFKNIQ